MVKNIQMKGRLTYKQIKLVAMVLLGSHKCNSELFDKGLSRFDTDLPWKPFLEVLYVTDTTAQVEESLAFKLHGSVCDVYRANWRIRDYISPGCLLYLVDRLHISLLEFRGSLVTARSSVVELGVMGLSLLAALALLLIFSPVLLGAAFILVVVVAGFTLTSVMALTSLSTLSWVFRSIHARYASKHHHIFTMFGFQPDEDQYKRTRTRGQEEEEEDTTKSSSSSTSSTNAHGQKDYSRMVKNQEIREREEPPKEAKDEKDDDDEEEEEEAAKDEAAATTTTTTAAANEDKHKQAQPDTAATAAPTTTTTSPRTRTRNRTRKS